MKMTLLLTITLSLGCLDASEPKDLSTFLESSYHHTAPVLDFDEQLRNVFHKISTSSIYFSTGTALGSVYLLARLGWGICQISPWASTIGNECLLLSHLCGSAAQHIFSQVFGTSPSPSPLFKGVPFSQSSWYLNKLLLSQIPAFSDEGKQLLQFLEKRWLAKSAGFYSTIVDWVCPCFGVDVQVHPETSNTYARDPWNQSSQTYKRTLEDWKQSLPHPFSFPLILTRPFDVRDYLPPHLDVPTNEKISKTVERLAQKMQTTDSQVVIDLTEIFSADLNDPEKWLQNWDAYRSEFAQTCLEYQVNLDRLICIQRLQQKQIGGLRLLPLAALPAEEVDPNYQFLLEWISTFGLSANRIELDRWPLPSNTSLPDLEAPSFAIGYPSKEEFAAYLHSFDRNWKLSHPQKTLMLKGTLQVLKGLLAVLSEDKWNEIVNCPTRSSVVEVSFVKIKEQLKLLAQEEEMLFFDTASHLEQIHADLSALIEIFAPFSFDDFPTIYQALLASIPSNLKPLASYGIHTSGMTSLTGVFKAVEKIQGRAPRVLYGENTYFENIIAAKLVSNAIPVEEATETDWNDVDLILAQFNPVLKRISLKKIDSTVVEYRAEEVAENLHKALEHRQGKPLTLAVDCTLDFIDSARIGDLLAEFQEELINGALNIICYRSGLKFDLFGMDNYCGAPFYMIHNQDPKWAPFDLLVTDPVLQTDQLSLNWFCLAYQNAGQELELYQKLIFDNTRSLLNKIPSSLLSSKNNYRVIPFKEGADPAFIDIKISGPYHQIRGSTLIGGILSMKCMEAGHPIFYRQSLGFYHPNFSVLFDEDCTTVRLTLGLDPAQVDLLAGCFETINALNGSSPQILDKLLEGLPSLSYSSEVQPSF